MSSIDRTGETGLRAPDQCRAHRIAGARIVLADDNADMRAYLLGLLSANYAVEAVADGEAALSAVRRERPDLILTDMMMPRIDGLALLAAVRAEERLKDIPVVLLSARAGEEARTEGLGAGADDYLTKPFSARELTARIGTLLELKEMRRDSEERFRAFVDASADVIFGLSPDFRVMRYLRGRSFVADTEQPRSSWFDDYLLPEDRPAMRAVLAKAIRTGGVVQLEHRVRRADGSVGWVATRAVPIRDRHGEVIEWFGTASDVTERKRTEEDLRERDRALADSNHRLRASEEALREADQRKTEFLALLGHELRNPLAPISAAGELLARTVSSHAQARVATDIICRQAAQLRRLMDDLLDIGRLTQGRLQLKRTPLELGSVIEQALETTAPQLQQKEHQVVLIGSAEPMYVLGDGARLVQCIANVLTNAAKFTYPKGRIRIERSADGAMAVIRISDNGAGISAELLPHIFEMFVQCDRTLDRAEGGLGVGLSIVRRLVEMHGGEVGAHSAGLGQGSTFEIRLPLIEAPEAVGMDERPARAPSRRVFVVDDNADAANSLAMLLGLAGHEAEVAHSARAALDRIEQFRPDVALLDIGLPDMSGYELGQQLRAMRPLEGVRLVALTGYGQPGDYERTRAAGFDDHLVKPVDLVALERSLAIGRVPDTTSDQSESQPTPSSISSS